MAKRATDAHLGMECPGGIEAHLAHLSVNGECPHCLHYCLEDD